jgi:transcriptional regulator with XRE-family HTH domain
MQEKMIFGFGARLQKLRKKMGITQKTLATVTGISLRTIEDYEQGKCKTPSAITILLLSSYFNIEPANLLYGGGNSADTTANGGSSMNLDTVYEKAIVEELKQINDFSTIKQIHDTALNGTILARLRLTEDLITATKADWEERGLLKTEESDGSSTAHKITRPYVKDTILKYAQNRGEFLKKYSLTNGVQILNEANGIA